MQPINTTSFRYLIGKLGGGSKHNEERYELHLCEKCFFYILATLEIERLVEHVLDENFDSATLDGFELK